MLIASGMRCPQYASIYGAAQLQCSSHRLPPLRATTMRRLAGLLVAQQPTTAAGSRAAGTTFEKPRPIDACDTKPCASWPAPRLAGRGPDLQRTHRTQRNAPAIHKSHALSPKTPVSAPCGCLAPYKVAARVDCRRACPTGGAGTSVSVRARRRGGARRRGHPMPHAATGHGCGRFLAGRRAHGRRRARARRRRPDGGGRGASWRMSWSFCRSSTFLALVRSRRVSRLSAPPGGYQRTPA